MTSSVAPLTTDQGAKSALYAATLSPGTDIRGSIHLEGLYSCGLGRWLQV